VLIDDRESLRSDWEAAGGIFVWHTSTATTLRALREKGILKDDDDDEACSSSKNKIVNQDGKHEEIKKEEKETKGSSSSPDAT
jgi:hypothetical protein